jgi:LacI family transcriptional regulator
MVSLCRGQKIPGLPTINCNNKLGIHILVNYLRELGHSNIVYIDGGWFGDVLERREEFLKIKNEDPNCQQFKWIKAPDDDYSGGYRIIDELLRLEPKPTAVIGSSDTLAVGLIKAAHDRGMSIPDDISVVGFDDITIAQFIEPSLTTIRQPIEDMGKKAIEILDRQIDGDELSGGEVFIEMNPRLIIRKSTRSLLE